MLYKNVLTLCDHKVCLLKQIKYYIDKNTYILSKVLKWQLQINYKVEINLLITQLYFKK